MCILHGWRSVFNVTRMAYQGNRIRRGRAAARGTHESYWKMHRMHVCVLKLLVSLYVRMQQTCCPKCAFPIGFAGGRDLRCFWGVCALPPHCQWEMHWTCHQDPALFTIVSHKSLLQG